MMGMFDLIRCEATLPETAVAPDAGRLFQTKDTPDQYMTVYTITADGRLTWRPYEMEAVPREERPYPDAPDDDFRSLCGSIRRVEQPPEDIPYHGDICFYGSGHTGAWWEYNARFTEGRLARIDLVEFTPPGDTP